MTLAKVCSALVGLGLALGVTAAQQPPEAAPKPQQQQKAPPKPPTDELEAAVAASANHPDVRLAQAKLQMAQAELDQAKLQVAQRIAAAHARLRSAQAQVEIEAQSYQRLSKIGSIPKTELLAQERVLAQAKAALAAAEADWHAARGQAPGHKAVATKDAPATAAVLQRMLLADPVGPPPEMLLSYLELANRTAPATGSAADKLRELVGKRVKLDLKEPVPFDRAMEEFIKQSGLSDLTIRSPEWANERFLKNPPKVGPLVGEQTVAGWFQLILDDFNRSLVTVGAPPDLQGKHEAYVRDYGLLITKTDLAPPGAPTLAEFARQAKAQNDAAAKSEPKKK